MRELPARGRRHHAAGLTLPALLCVAALACAHTPELPPRSEFWGALGGLRQVYETAPGTAPGHVTVVNFFATWCFPCLTMVSPLMKLQADHQKDGVQVIGIGLDLEENKVLEPFAQYYQLNYPVLLPSDAMRAGQSAFGPVPELPLTVVLDRRGQLVTAYRGVLEAGALEELVQRTLKASPPR